MKRVSRFFAAIVGALGISGATMAISATNPEATTPTPPRTMAINVLPHAFAYNEVSANYEYLIAQKHGVLSELWLDRGGAKGYGLGAGYRFHFSPNMESWFVGLYANYSKSQGYIKEEGIKYDLEIMETRYGANIGKRWVWDSGLNLVLRLGGGESDMDLSYKGNKKPKSSWFFEGLFESAEDIGRIDGEVSVGYAF